MLVSDEDALELLGSADLTADGLTNVVETTLRSTVEKLKAQHGGDLEALTDEWLRQLDDANDLPGPDAIVIRVLDWLLPEKLFDLLNYGSAKVEPET